MTSTLDASTSPREKGVALFIVLWALLLLAVLASSFLLEARATRTIGNTAATRLEARWLTDGAINRAIMSLLDRRDPLHLSLDGTTIEIEFLGHRIQLSCESEAGKVDLNTAPRELLASLLVGEGLSDEEARSIAEQIAIWRSPARGGSEQAAVALYKDGGRPYGPRFGAFRSIGELRLVLGMNDRLQSALSPFITVWSSTGTIDRGVAKEQLLQLLAAGNDNLAAAQLSARQVGHAAGADRSVALGEVLTISASLTSTDETVRRTASVQIAGDRNAPYRVLQWH